MTRTQIASLMALIAGLAGRRRRLSLPRAPSPASSPAIRPIASPTTGAANITVRIDNAAARPNLRMQIVDDPAAADFVLIDDGDTGDACQGAVETIRLDNKAGNPDLTVALSRAAAGYKIYVRSARFSAQDAAALFAVMWRDARGAGAVAARD